MVTMSKTSRKYHVPDALAHVYDFANTLDLRSFIHHGVKCEPSDDLRSPGDLAAWLAERALPGGGGKVTPKAFHAALRLREGLREYLERDPTERSRDGASLRKLNESLEAIPFVVQVSRGKPTMTMQPIQPDALAGLGAVVNQLYDASASGELGRLKMCASEECRRVFYDRSKPATRRWCQSALCGNRMKTRAYRERHRPLA
jgi:predicted RNA-binding Zn ribbon-like protein